MTVNTTNSAVKEPEKSWMVGYYEYFLKWQNQVVINIDLVRFCENYLCTMEGMFDTDPDSLSPEHKEEYISCAQFMEDNYGRKINRIKEVKAKL